MNRGAGVRAAGVVAAAILSLLVVLGALEAAARLLGVRARSPVVPMFSWAQRGELYTLAPGRKARRTAKVPVRVNALGVRGPEVGAKDGRPRILLLGDSVAFGYGVTEDLALPEQIRRMLAARRHEVDVVGAAVPGWCARQHRLFLAKHGDDLDPDLVLATVVLNDVRELKVGEAELSASLGMANALNWLSERSAFVSWVRLRLARSLDPFASDAWIEALAYDSESRAVRSAMAAEMEELEQLAATSRASGAPLALVVLPFRFQLGDPGSDAPQRALASFAAREGIPLLDVLPALRPYGREEVFLDHVHLSAKGNEVVADAVADWLASGGLVGGAPAADAARAVDAAAAPRVQGRPALEASAPDR